MNTPQSDRLNTVTIIIIILIVLSVGTAAGFFVGTKFTEPVIQEKIVVETVEVTPQVCLDFVNSSNKMLNYAGESMQIASEAMGHMQNNDTRNLEADAIRLQEIADEIRQERITYDNTQLECQKK